jgi:hypothetical protein
MKWGSAQAVLLIPLQIFVCDASITWHEYVFLTTDTRDKLSGQFKTDNF